MSVIKNSELKILKKNRTFETWEGIFTFRKKKILENLSLI